MENLVAKERAIFEEDLNEFSEFFNNKKNKD
jgi:hypothetical protein